MDKKDINKVSLLVDDEVYDGWKSARIEAGIDQICRSFAVEVTDNFPGNLGKFIRLRAGQSVVVKIGKDTVCTGYITSTPISYNAKSVTVEIQGKSKTVDLVDCCSPWAAIGPAKTTQSGEGSDTWKDVDPDKNKTAKVSAAKVAVTSWHNQPTEKIIADLCAPYGISVVCKSDIGGKHTNFTVNPGEKVFESINRLLVKDNLIVTDDEFGNLLIAEVGQEGVADDELKTGENVLTGRAEFDANPLYSTYAVLGQHKGSDLEFGRQVSQDKSIQTSSFVGRYRLLVVKDTGQSSKQSAESLSSYEKEFREAKYFSALHLVQGWRQSSSKLWRPNQLVDLYDSVLQIKGQNHLVQKVVFVLDAGGAIAQIASIPKKGYGRKGGKTDKLQGKSNKAISSSNAWADVK